MLSNTPVVLSEYAVARFLKAFAHRLGMEPVMAEAAAQVHMQTPSLTNWSKFFQANCPNCTLDPATCRYLNPTRDDLRPGQSVVTVRGSVAQMIESGRIQTCPARQAP